MRPGIAQEAAPPSIEQARALRDAGKLADAAAAFEQLIVAQPEVWEMRYEVAQIHMALKELDAAETQLQAALLISPGQAAAWARLGQVYLLKADPEDAERALVRARDLDPLDSGVHYNLGKLYELAARDADALREYTAFLAQAGDDPRAGGIRRRLVRYYENKNQADKVLEQYRALCLLEPANLQARQGLADALYKQSAYDDAFAEYQKALSLDPNNAAVQLNIGFIYKMKGNLEEAERTVRIADSLNPGAARTLYLLGSIQFERGDFPGAAASFEKTIALEPEHPQAHYHLSRALARLGRQEDARRELQLHQEIMKKAEEKSSSTTMERP